MLGWEQRQRAFAYVKWSPCLVRGVGSVRRQGWALQRGEFGIGGVARDAVVLHVDMHVLPGVGARGLCGAGDCLLDRLLLPSPQPPHTQVESKFRSASSYYFVD